MKKLSSLIKWMKTGNVSLFIVAMLIGLTAISWIVLDVGLGKAFAQDTSGQHSATVSADKSTSSYAGWGLLAAALSTGLSAIAAGIAVAMVGSAAMGAVAERPEVMGRSIIFVGLAEGIAIYGLIISIMILGKI
jgi:V/A-type H+-transporting ATPase subunit K